MRHLKLLIASALAISAFATVCTAVAQAEGGNPAALLLETGVANLEVKFSGLTDYEFGNLAGKKLEGTGVEGTLKGCKEEGSTKDTSLCEPVTFTFKSLKEEKVACRSENAKGEKDAIETVLVVVDLHLAAEETSSKVLEPLLLLKVLGMSGGEKELVINCGGVKNKIKGVLGCLLTPGLANVAATEELSLECTQNATTHDQVTGKCEKLCELLEKEPFLSSLGGVFEDSGMNIDVKGKPNKDVFLDD